MTQLIFFSVILINLLLGIKSIFYPLNRILDRKNVFIAVLSFIGCYILMSGYRNYSGLSKDLSNGAYEFYQILNGSSSVYEIGYIALIKLGSLFTQDYYVWRQVIIFAFLLILFLAIYNDTENPHFVYASFCAYLIILSSEQLRNFIALVVFYIGLLALIKSENKNRKLFFIIMTILAGTVHSIFYVYLLLVFAYNSFSMKTIKRIAIMSMLFCVFIFINGNSIPGLSFLLSLIGGKRASLYLMQKTRLGFLYPMVMHLSSVFISYYVSKSSNMRLEESETILKINMIMMVCFPLYMLQITFYRIARNLLLITYLLEGESILSTNIGIDKKLVIIALSLMAIALWFYIDLFITTPAEALLYPFFENNFFFCT